LRVLFTAKHTPSGDTPKGGVQSWIKTIRAEFEEMGHECTEWDSNGRRPKGGFDLGIVANARYFPDVLGMCEKTINVSHGIIPDEAPMPSHSEVMFVSENVREHWLGRGEIIRQPIDLMFWAPIPDVTPEEVLLRYSYRHAEIPGAEVAAKLGLQYRHVMGVSHAQACVHMAKAKVVLATGRAALEAMSVGRPVVICDHRSAYQGALMCPDIRKAMHFSYSGRGGWFPTSGDLREAVEDALAMPKGFWRDWVKRHHDSKAIALQLLA